MTGWLIIITTVCGPALLGLYATGFVIYKKRNQWPKEKKRTVGIFATLAAIAFTVVWAVVVGVGLFAIGVCILEQQMGGGQLCG